MSCSEENSSKVFRVERRSGQRLVTNWFQDPPSSSWTSPPQAWTRTQPSRFADFWARRQRETFRLWQPFISLRQRSSIFLTEWFCWQMGTRSTMDRPRMCWGGSTTSDLNSRNFRILQTHFSNLLTIPRWSTRSLTRSVWPWIWSWITSNQVEDMMNMLERTLTRTSVSWTTQIESPNARNGKYSLLETQKCLWRVQLAQLR